MKDEDIDELIGAIRSVAEALKENTAAMVEAADLSTANPITLWRKFLAEIDDLKTAMITLTTAVSDAATEMKAVADALVALKGNNINPADVAAIAQEASTLAANLESAVAATKTEAGV